jgi:hypothetical protein
MLADLRKLIDLRYRIEPNNLQLNGLRALKKLYKKIAAPLLLIKRPPFYFSRVYVHVQYEYFELLTR